MSTWENREQSYEGREARERKTKRKKDRKREEERTRGQERKEMERKVMRGLTYLAPGLYLAVEMQAVAK